MSELPKLWAVAQLGEINQFASGNIDPSSFSSERFELYSVPSFPSGKPEFPLGSEIGSTKQLVAPNDVLISKINPRINRVWQVGPNTKWRQIASSEWIAFRNAAFDSRYFKHYFSSSEFRDRLCADVTGVGGSLTRAQPKRVATFQIPIAPAAEQKRIADKLDTVLTRVDAVNTRLARVAPLLKRFRQSVLAAATSGRLTEDWRAVNQINSDWLGKPALALKDYAKLDMGFAFKSADFLNEGLRLLRGDNIEPGGLRWRDAKHIDEDAVRDLGHLMLKVGDLVLAMDRPIISTGLKLARVNEQDVPCVLVQRVCKFNCTPSLSKDFLFLVLQGTAFINHLGAVQNGSGVPHISGAQILSFRLQLPSADEQTEIVRRVETLFAFADRLEARLAQAQTAATRLTPALLAKAFRGELVPQDPNDEPAAELLRRLQAERATAPKASAGRGRKAAVQS